MTDEVKVEETKCKCCECREKFVKGLKEFLFKTAVVYVGATLAIITAANFVKPPKCPCKMNHHPRFERQMLPPPPHMMHGNFDNFRGGYHANFKMKHKDTGFGGKHQRPEFAPNAGQDTQPPVAPKK